jgi:hypothetical protein
MWVCPAAPTSIRRYEYIEYENGRLLGEKKACTRGTTKVIFEIAQFNFKLMMTSSHFRLIHGGDICFGIVAIASVFVMSKEKNPTDILISDPLSQTSQTTCKSCAIQIKRFRN